MAERLEAPKPWPRDWGRMWPVSRSRDLCELPQYEKHRPLDGDAQPLFFDDPTKRVKCQAHCDSYVRVGELRRLAPMVHVCGTCFVDVIKARIPKCADCRKPVPLPVFNYGRENILCDYCTKKLRTCVKCGVEAPRGWMVACEGSNDPHVCDPCFDLQMLGMTISNIKARDRRVEKT